MRNCSHWKQVDSCFKHKTVYHSQRNDNPRELLEKQLELDWVGWLDFMVYQPSWVIQCQILFIHIHTHTYIYVVPSISFQTFFVQAFKIIVDTWKFSMSLLYILWDDWPIFMISTSNEQLQQQLEYTLLKPDCHSWWISKMQSDTLEEWYAIKLCFKLGKNATDTYGMFHTAFRASCMNQASVFKWHKRIKEGRESVRDDERCGRSKKVNTPQLIGQRVRVRVTMLRF